MKDLFAWPVIDALSISEETRYSYGHVKNGVSIDEWSVNKNDLNICIKVKLNLNGEDLKTYLYEDEDAHWVISWRGDDKFSGVGKSVILDSTGPQNLICKIPSNSFLNSFEVVLYLIARSKNQINRQDGSIICQKQIYKKTSLGTSSFFPVKEFEGSGKNLLYWDFSNLSDLDISVMDSVSVNVDLKYPFIKNKNEVPDHTCPR